MSGGGVMVLLYLHANLKLLNNNVNKYLFIKYFINNFTR